MDGNKQKGRRVDGNYLREHEKVEIKPWLVKAWCTLRGGRQICGKREKNMLIYK